MLNPLGPHPATIFAAPIGEIDPLVYVLALKPALWVEVAAIQMSRPSYAIAASLGLTQIISWGSTLYFPAAMGREIPKSFGAGLEFVFGGVSAIYLVGALIAPLVGRRIDIAGARTVMTAGSLIAAAGFISLSMATAARLPA